MTPCDPRQLASATAGSGSRKLHRRVERTRGDAMPLRKCGSRASIARAVDPKYEPDKLHASVSPPMVK